MALTKKQRQILDFVESFVDSNGYSPSYEEIAEVTGYSVPTVKRDWARARAWLFHFVRGDGAAGDAAPSTSA